MSGETFFVMFERATGMLGSKVCSIQLRVYIRFSNITFCPFLKRWAPSTDVSHECMRPNGKTATVNMNGSENMFAFSWRFCPFSQFKAAVFSGCTYLAVQVDERTVILLGSSWDSRVMQQFVMQEKIALSQCFYLRSQVCSKRCRVWSANIQAAGLHHSHSILVKHSKGQCALQPVTLTQNDRMSKV